MSYGSRVLRMSTGLLSRYGLILPEVHTHVDEKQEL